VERGAIQPLQIVDEEDERMLDSGEHAHEALQGSLEAHLSLLRRKLRDELLRTDDQLQVGYEVDDELRVRAERFSDLPAPAPQVGVTREEHGTYEIAEGSGNRRERNVTLTRVELTGDEESASADDDLLKLVDDGGFSGSGVSRYEDERLPAVAGDALERIDQRGDLTRAAVKPLGDQQSVRHVVRGKRERLEATGGLPVRQASPQVGLDAAGGLVAVFRVLRQQLEDDRGEHRGNPGDAVARWHGPSRAAAADPFHPLGGGPRGGGRH